jgi:hypothetical protein
MKILHDQYTTFLAIFTKTHKIKLDFKTLLNFLRQLSKNIIHPLFIITTKYFDDMWHTKLVS